MLCWYLITLHVVLVLVRRWVTRRLTGCKLRTMFLNIAKYGGNNDKLNSNLPELDWIRIITGNYVILIVCSMVTTVTFRPFFILYIICLRLFTRWKCKLLHVYIYLAISNIGYNTWTAWSHFGWQQLSYVSLFVNTNTRHTRRICQATMVS